MKIKHLMIAGCLFTAFTLQSCIKEKDLYQAPPTTYSELNLQLDGDYLSTELPMARATTPTKINESETLVGIAITMQNHIMLYRRFFGVKFKQTGLEKGRLRIKLEDAPSIYLNANADIHKTVESELKMVSMRNLTANIPTGDNQHLTENVKVEVFWEETPGAEEKTIISSSITFKRNYTHSIALTNIEHIGTPSDIGIEVESGEMGEDIEQDIPWQ